MGKIKILEQGIASKIAAGEVIERPVSVVKELVENSIDASSKNIIIEIKKGGKKIIQVIDDGEGMTREDVKLAFKRHATSKISNLNDIFNINTLGFRGEALSSIASVSKVSLISKTQEESIGTLCKINGGIFDEIGDASTKDGCIIEVEDLFFNTPARLKFLNNDTHEASRITDIITRFAIGNIDISFRLINNEKEIFYTSGNGDYREAIAKVYGVDLAKQAIYIEENFKHGKIWGYISTPQYARGNRTGQTFFVNKRFVKDKGLVSALERAYKTMIPINRFPVAVIFIDIDSSQVDVNVHPTKTEIKFQKANEVHKALYNAVKNSLKTQVLIPEETFEKPYIQATKNTGNENQIKLSSETLPKNEYYPNNGSKICKETVSKEPLFVKELPKIEKEKVSVSKETYDNPIPIFLEEAVTIKTTNRGQKLDFGRILGQLFNTYIVAQGKDIYYLIDQHAAHERILYEYYSNKFNKLPDSQRLVTPYLLHLSAQEMLIIEDFKEDILNMGFDFSIFGTDSILVRSVPYLFNKPVEPTVLRDVFDYLITQEDAGFHNKEKLIISMSCHTAIKAGDILSVVEIQHLLQQLKNTENPYTCPHGRPTIIAMTRYELEKKFKRVQ